MGNRFRERNKELAKDLETGGRYKIHWFRRLLVFLFIVGFWIIYYYWNQP